LQLPVPPAGSTGGRGGSLVDAPLDFSSEIPPMNLRVTIGFLVVALVMGVLVVGLDKFNIGPTAASNANATSTTTAIQQPQIFQFDDQKVNAFELHQADKIVRVEKQ